MREPRRTAALAVLAALAPTLVSPQALSSAPVSAPTRTTDVLLHVAEHGLCNRLRSVAAAYLLGQELDSPAVGIAWSPSPPCNASFSPDLFLPTLGAAGSPGAVEVASTSFAAFREAGLAATGSAAPKQARRPSLVHVHVPASDPMRFLLEADGSATISGGGSPPRRTSDAEAFVYAGAEGIIDVPPALLPVAASTASTPTRTLLHVATDSANVPASLMGCSSFLRRKGAFYRDVLLPALHPSVALAHALARFGLAALHAQGWGSGIPARIPGAKTREDPLPLPPVAASLIHAIITANGTPTLPVLGAALRPLEIPTTAGLHIRAFDGAHDYPVVPSSRAGGRVGFGDPRGSSLTGFVNVAAAAVKAALTKAHIPHNATVVPPGKRGFGSLPAFLVVSNVCLGGFATASVRAGVAEALGLSRVVSNSLLIESPRSLFRDAVVSLRSELAQIRGLTPARRAIVEAAIAGAEAVVNAACGPDDTGDAPASRDATSARSALFEWSVLSSVSSLVVGSYWSSFSEEAAVAAAAIRGAQYVAVGEGSALLMAPAPFDAGGVEAADETCGYPAYVRRALRKAAAAPSSAPSPPSSGIAAGIEQYTFDLFPDPATAPPFHFVPCGGRLGVVGLDTLRQTWGLDADAATTLYCPPS